MYGDSNGYQGIRAQLSLFEGMTHLGYIRFVDPDVAIPNDNMTGGLIYMHQSVTMLNSFLDVLRSESNVFFYFGNNHTFFGYDRP